jgi:putative phosphoribosyl transferase
MTFSDRTDAGRRLASRLEHLRGSNAVALGLPRGGVPVAAVIATALDIPLDVVVVRKLGVPYQPELAMGAIGEGGVRVLNDDVLRFVSVTPEALAHVEAAERRELERRSHEFRQGREPTALAGRTAIVIDDGIATGATARAACQIVRAAGAQRVVLAVPVAPPESVHSLADVADEIVCVRTPATLSSIGQWYEDFRQTPDSEVIRLLEQASARQSPTAGTHASDVIVPTDGPSLPGQLTVPPGAAGVVVFAHGSGSSRLSPRNQYVAAVQVEGGLGTLLFDLLTPDEAADRANVFDIDVLSSRITAAIRWLSTRPDTSGLGIGVFGASTGAAAALWSAAELGPQVRAVVSRGGRPDLAADRLADVSAPTLLIVGELDDTVLALNRRSERQLRCTHRLDIVPGATHLFEEPGTLDTVARLARDWFQGHLTGFGSDAATNVGSA